MELSPKDKLKAIISAQVKGWYHFYDRLDEPVVEDSWVLFGDNHCSVLEILLDVAGRKAAYPGIHVCADGSMVERWSNTGHKILEAWDTGEGNSWKEAIDVAPSLLSGE